MRRSLTRGKLGKRGRACAGGKHEEREERAARRIAACRVVSLRARAAWLKGDEEYYGEEQATGAWREERKEGARADGITRE